MHHAWYMEYYVHLSGLVVLTYSTHLYISFSPVEILFRELEVRQVALCHLIHFLKETGEQKLLLDLLR